MLKKKVYHIKKDGGGHAKSPTTQKNMQGC